MKLFHICTIANKIDQYQEMKASFLAAGFDEERCRYSLFDNSERNNFDPYETFNCIQKTSSEPYIIFCHQDIVLDQGDGFDQLVQCLDNLESVDSNWAIAGNAGVNNHYELVARITEPNNTKNWEGKFPQRVHSLDENFLVIKTTANLETSRSLKGFHLYGTDLCLNAIVNNYSCYVVDFHLTHLSGGNLSDSFWEGYKNFRERWKHQFLFTYIQTVTCMTMCSSRYSILQKIGSRSIVMNWFLSRKQLPLVCQFKQLFAHNS